MEVKMIICDCCKEEIPKEKKKDFFGIEREYYKFGKLSYWDHFIDIDCHVLGLDLCEKCASKLSIVIHKEITEQIGKY